MALSLILFDCDGVLVDSEIISAKVDAALLKELGYEISASEVAERFAGLTQDRILELLTGVHDMLDRLDLPRAICSNSSSERLKIVLEPTRLWDRFRPYVYAAREVGTMRPKPAPDVYLYGCRQFDAEPRQTVVLEDSVHGVAAAVAAGCRVVGFTGGQHSYAGPGHALAEAGAETVIRKLSEFPAVVEALSSWEEA